MLQDCSCFVLRSSHSSVPYAGGGRWATLRSGAVWAEHWIDTRLSCRDYGSAASTRGPDRNCSLGLQACWRCWAFCRFSLRARRSENSTLLPRSSAAWWIAAAPVSIEATAHLIAQRTRQPMHAYGRRFGSLDQAKAEGRSTLILDLRHRFGSRAAGPGARDVGAEHDLERGR